mmetsp:Transcript_14297/g.32756  ORF Transcript_14297/g.32756 Transcript_14297/m.32756 type:complete len:99 (-) Transcript_14297:124-420(-)
MDTRRSSEPSSSSSPSSPSSFSRKQIKPLKQGMPPSLGGSMPMYTLFGITALSLLGIVLVHNQQNVEKQQLHSGVVRDIERLRLREERERITKQQSRS